jgi:hypothetical protein
VRHSVRSRGFRLTGPGLRLTDDRPHGDDHMTNEPFPQSDLRRAQDRATSCAREAAGCRSRSEEVSEPRALAKAHKARRPWAWTKGSAAEKETRAALSAFRRYHDRRGPPYTLRPLGQAAEPRPIEVITLGLSAASDSGRLRGSRRAPPVSLRPELIKDTWVTAPNDAIATTASRRSRS